MISLLIFIALLGLINSGYLVWKHYGPRRGPLVCPFNQACDVVLDSKYGRALGIRNELIGAAFYLLTLALLVLAWRGSSLPVTIFGLSDPLRIAFFISIPAFVVSLALTAIQHFILKNYCSYCLLANLLNALLFFGLLLLT